MPSELLVEAGGPAPTDPAGHPIVLFRIGDVLRVSCPFATAQVMKADKRQVVLRWPWPVPDAWAGKGIAFPFEELDITPFRTEPALESLREGAHCRVGIPPTDLYVLAVGVFDPPLRAGSLGRQSVVLGVAPSGTPPVVDLRIKGYRFEPYGSEPIRVERLFRPYHFLEDGDVVADALGARWRFQAPYWFAMTTQAPELTVQGLRWPLTVVERAGHAASPTIVTEVARETATGSHDAVLATWQRFAGVDPDWLRAEEMPRR